MGGWCNRIWGLGEDSVTLKKHVIGLPSGVEAWGWWVECERLILLDILTAWAIWTYIDPIHPKPSTSKAALILKYEATWNGAWSWYWQNDNLDSSNIMKRCELNLDGLKLVTSSIMRISVRTAHPLKLMMLMMMLMLMLMLSPPFKIQDEASGHGGHGWRNLTAH